MFSFFIANGFPICLSDRKQANDGSTPRLCLSSVEIKGGNVRVRGVNRIDRGHTTFFLIAALAGLLTSCDRDGDPIRAALAERESSWARRLSALKGETAALVERSARLAPATDQSPPVLRARAVVDGASQALTDVEIQARQVRSRVELAMPAGAEVARRTLDEVAVQMNGYLDGLAADLSAANRQLTELSQKD
jgi:hypothetical protein